MCSGASGAASSVKLVWANAGYAGALVKWVAVFCTFVLQIVRRPEEVKGIVLVKLIFDSWSRKSAQILEKSQ